MGRLNRTSDEFTFMAAKASNGIGNVMFIKDWKAITFSIDTIAATDGNIKVQTACSDTTPDFSAAQSPTNRWDYCQIVQKDTGSTINGTAGVSPAGAINRQYELQSNGATWLSFVISGYTTGSYTVKGTGYSN